MVTKAEEWTLEKDLCRCCHAEGTFDNLANPQSFMNQEEIYSDMIKYCFDIEISPVPGSMCAATYTICPNCVLKIRDATSFKRQVQLCEKKFFDLWHKKAISESVQLTQIKDEPEIFYPSDEFPVDDGETDMEGNDGSPAADEYSDSFFDHKESLEDEQEDKSEEDIKPNTKKKKQKEKTKTKSKKQKEEKPKASSKETKEFPLEGQKVKPKYFLGPEDYTKKNDLWCCTRCDKQYDKPSSLRVHVKTFHLKLPRYICEICDKTFMTLSPFTRHKLQEHNIDDRFDCSACQAKFNTKVQLRRHTNTFHMLGMKHKCDSCDYESFSFESLYKHKYKHRTVKDFLCRFCKKAFLRKTTLDLHERIHTGDRRKVCQVCGQAFVQKASLNYHMTKYHPAVAF